MFKIGFFIVSLAFGYFANAENYFVEPLICKGKWNQAPKNFHPSYEQVVLTVVSFRSVKKDCTLVNSTGTDTNYNLEAQNTTVFDTVDYLGSSFGRSLYINDNTVELSGAWYNLLTLKVVSTKIIDGQRIDTLVGREIITGSSYYDYTCEAVVVETPSHIENNTANCP